MEKDRRGWKQQGRRGDGEVTGVLGGDKSGWGRWWQKGATGGVCCKRVWGRLKGRRRGGRVAGGRFTGGQRKRSLGEEAESDDTSGDGGEKEKRGCERAMFRLQLRLCSPPVISVSPSATRSVCARVCVCVWEQWGSIRQERKASQDARPIVARGASRAARSSEALPRVMGLQSNLSTEAACQSTLSLSTDAERKSRRKREILLRHESDAFFCLFFSFFSRSWIPVKADLGINSTVKEAQLCLSTIQTQLFARKRGIGCVFFLL